MFNLTDTLARSAVKTQFTLPHVIALYVPGTVSVNVKTNTAEFAKNVAAEFARLFGGSTIRENLGYWISDTADLVEETTREVFSFASDAALSDNLATVLQLAESIKRDLSQESVLVSVDGQALFV